MGLNDLGGGVRAGGLRNLSSIQFSAIPDSGLLHRYDFSDKNTTTSTVPDLAGTADLTGSFTDLAANINGRQAGTFDGVDDFVDVAYGNEAEPSHRYLVIRDLDPSGTAARFYIDGFSNYLSIYYNGGSGEYALFRPSSVLLSGISADTSNRLITGKFNGSSSEIRIDGTLTNSGTVGSGTADGMTIGREYNGSSYANIVVGEVLVYDPSASGYAVSDVESYLSDKWGITI